MSNKIVAVYERVSTDEQNPQARINESRQYLEDEYPDHEIRDYVDMASGASSALEQRTYFLELKGDIERGEIEAVATTNVDRVSRSIRDLEDFIRHCDEYDTAVEFTRESLSFDPENQDPYNRAMLRLLGVFAELEKDMIQSRTKEGIRHAREQGVEWGRPPLGYEKENGITHPSDDYDRICSVLQMIDDGELSQSEGAHRLDTSRTTVRRILTDDERRELYNLSTGDQDAE